MADFTHADSLVPPTAIAPPRRLLAALASLVGHHLPWCRLLAFPPVSFVLRRSRDDQPAAGSEIGGRSKASRRGGRGRPADREVARAVVWRRQRGPTTVDQGAGRRLAEAADGDSGARGGAAVTEDAGEEKRCLSSDAATATAPAAAVAWQRSGERRGATERWRVAGPIDPRRDNNNGQGVVTSTKVDDAMDSNGIWIGDLH
ncbi:hypothetical protein Scep_004866 [Stephania cephalantha]|uniref:Uncharacterized protein n=1 Tax=Stephania cephalantha TaxID=152367 RepID=A0AAP0KT84_9MAGN